MGAGYAQVEKIFFHLEEPEHVPDILHYALFWRCSFWVAGSRYCFIATRRRTRSLFRFSPTGFTSTISTTGWSENVQDGLAMLSGWVDRWVVDLFVVQIPGRFTWACGYVLRFLQLGNIQAYAFFFGAGVIGLIYILLAHDEPVPLPHYPSDCWCGADHRGNAGPKHGVVAAMPSTSWRV